MQAHSHTCTHMRCACCSNTLNWESRLVALFDEGSSRIPFPDNPFFTSLPQMTSKAQEQQQQQQQAKRQKKDAAGGSVVSPNLLRVPLQPHPRARTHSTQLLHHHPCLTHPHHLPHHPLSLLAPALQHIRVCNCWQSFRWVPHVSGSLAPHQAGRRWKAWSGLKRQRKGLIGHGSAMHAHVA